MKREYALYHGERYVYSGTIKEISEKTGITEKTIKFYGTPTYKKRRKEDGNSYMLYPLEEKEV